MSAVLIVLGTMLLSAMLCALYLPLARRWQLVDRPGARSSHDKPTPLGGGAPLQLAFLCGCLFVAVTIGQWGPVYGLLLALSLLLAVLGVVDDLKNLPVALRFALYSIATLVAAASLLWGLPALGGFALPLILLAAFAMLWFLNLYNFMDGIDGIAALQSIFACASAALLSLGSGDLHYVMLCLLLAAAHAGFLLWNWPPARLFMGDSGSISSGFLIAAMTLLGAVQGQLNPLCWLILMAGFITDATWTLLWRWLHGEPVTQAHRSHAYQRLSRYWGSHLRVDLSLLAINLLWLLPLAALAQHQSGYGLFLVILAYLPLLAGMAKIRRLT